MKNANHTQELLPKKVTNVLPPLYAQDGKGMEAIAYAKYFLESWSWYVSEFNPETGEMFGLVVSSHCPEGELGYFNINELAQTMGRITAVERDIHWKPTPLSQCPRLG